MSLQKGARVGEGILVVAAKGARVGKGIIDVTAKGALVGEGIVVIAVAATAAARVGEGIIVIAVVVAAAVRVGEGIVVVPVVATAAARIVEETITCRITTSLRLVMNPPSPIPTINCINGKYMESIGHVWPSGWVVWKVAHGPGFEPSAKGGVSSKWA